MRTVRNANSAMRCMVHVQYTYNAQHIDNCEQALPTVRIASTSYILTQLSVRAHAQECEAVSLLNAVPIVCLTKKAMTFERRERGIKRNDYFND